MDLTNVVEHPLACVITSISLEHTEYLGNTVEQIAGEKAGIIKSGAAVIYEGFQDNVSRVIEKKAAGLGDTIDFSLKNGYYDNTVITIPFVAPYQVINSSLALITLEVLREKLHLSRDTIIKGMRHTKWQGRMETVLPGIIVDGAHNDDGIRRFVETAVQFQDRQDITLLFSAVVEKDYPAMIKRICSQLKLKSVVTTQIDGQRVVPAIELAELFEKNGCADVTAEEEIGKAFETARKKKGDGLLFCVGSLYLVGEVKDYIRRNTND